MMTGCGLIELDPNDEAKVPTKMYFQPDTVYVMEGDTFQVQPLFEPDSVNNKVLTWGSLNEDVVRLQNDTLIAEQEGWARIIVTSVAALAIDSLDVCVMKPWVISETRYPYEMVVFADVSVHGQPITQDMTLAAFSGTSIRGVATPIAVGQKTLWRFRIYNDAEFTLPYAETPITFWVYDRKTLQRRMFPTYIIFNGETYGSPSQPIELKIE
ncbi:MAG: hypothetical protein J5545_07055 [Bacteroidaceae bacterium]|nr:hypothetical protein [Bacteroidaceae bacterium]